MMAEENMTTWRDDEETILDSDIWRVAKNLTPYASPEDELEAWERTVKVLDRLCGMAEALRLDPLYLALVDAISRAQDERERAVDRTKRPAGELTDREASTLRGLLTRADAIGNAYLGAQGAAHRLPGERGTVPRGHARAQGGRPRAVCPLPPRVRAGGLARGANAGPGCNRLGPFHVLEYGPTNPSDAD